MPNVVTIDISQMKRLEQTLGEIGRFVGDMTPYFEAAVPVIQRLIGDTFDQEGPGWAPLKPETIAGRIRAGFAAGPILHMSGALRRAATDDADVDISSDTLLYRTTLPYAAAHQFGYRPGGLPARPFIRTELIAPAVAEVFEKEFRTRVIDRLKGAI